MAMHSQEITLLLLLHLSNAFDTIDHSSLSETLMTCFGIDGIFLEWIESYSANRHQKIKIDDVISDEFPVHFRVPIKIKSDLLMAMHSQEITLLLLLHLSNAFDTIDHSSLSETLMTCFGIDGIFLEWIESYSANRHQKIKIDDVISDEFPVHFRVPEGSRPGPLLFTLYTANLISNVQTNFPEIIIMPMLCR